MRRGKQVYGREEEFRGVESDGHGQQRLGSSGLLRAGGQSEWRWRSHRPINGRSFEPNKSTDIQTALPLTEPSISPYHNHQQRLQKIHWVYSSNTLKNKRSNPPQFFVSSHPPTPTSLRSPLVFHVSSGFQNPQPTTYPLHVVSASHQWSLRHC
jgi:hypothetical protein